MTTDPTTSQFDIVIAGGGPAGLACALYAARAGLSVTVFDRGMPGGQVGMTEWIDNYPGFSDGVSGFDLAEKMLKHAQRFGAEITYGNIENFACTDCEEAPYLHITLDDGRSVGSRTLVIATGAQPRLLGVPGEEKFRGRGVSYCAICDGNFFKGKEVAVIGGGDAAVEEAVYLSKLCSKVTVIHRRDQLRASQIAQDSAFDRPNIEFAWNSRTIEITGTGEKASGVLVADTTTGSERIIPADGIFIYVGINPITDFLKGKLEIDDQGFVITKDNMETSMKGVYAVGDVRRPQYRQIATAIADGVTAALAIDGIVHQKPPRLLKQW